MFSTLSLSSRLRIAGILTGAVLLITSLATGQTQQDHLTVDVDLVNIPFTVCNKRGKLIRDLNPENFLVFEDNLPQTITNFSRDTDGPLTIALVIDTSGSVRDRLHLERQAAVEFLRSTLIPTRDKAAVFTFDTNVKMALDYTDDPFQLEQAIHNARSGGGTRLYDALDIAIKHSLAFHEGRRGIILLTDGFDNLSSTTPEEVIEAAQRHNVTIYAISMNNIDFPSRRRDRGDGILKLFADETGGNAFFPDKIKDLSKDFANIRQELRSQYTLAYRSTNDKKDGAYRKVRITVINNDYAVRARAGYYAAPAAVVARPN